MWLVHYLSSLRAATASRWVSGHRGGGLRLTFADRPVVAPGGKHLGHPLAGDGLGALEYVVLVAAELSRGTDAGHGTDSMVRVREVYVSLYKDFGRLMSFKNTAT